MTDDEPQAGRERRELEAEDLAELCGYDSDEAFWARVTCDHDDGG